MFNFFAKCLSPLWVICRFFFGSFLRCFISCSLGLILLIVTALGVVGWKGSDFLLTPPRRDIQDYHTEILNNPEKHSIIIEEYEAVNRTPCLIVTRDPKTSVSYKGETLIKELSKRKVAIGFNTYGTIVMVHGRMGRKEDLLPVAERFSSVGFRCICIDLPAHGDHPDGQTCYGGDEAQLLKDVYQDIKTHLNIDESEPEFLYGFSMGGAVAIRAAAQDSEWDGVITISTFANLRDVIDHQIRPKAAGYNVEFLTPVASFAIETVASLRSRLHIKEVNSEKLIQSIDKPIVLIHGDNDWLIPDSHSDRLFDAIQHDKKALIKVPGASHHDALAKGGNPLYLELCTFLLKHRLPEEHLSKR